MVEKDILKIIQEDKWMMNILKIAQDLNLPNWMIGAGFIRNKVWDYLSGNNKDTVDTGDIDLVYFDPSGNNEEADEKLSEDLRQKTGIKWEVVNEFYAHKWNNLPPYTSTEDAISQWPETVTAIGINFDKNGELKLFLPYGIDDLINFKVRPSPNYKGRIEKIRDRVKQKNWTTKWPKIKILV
ncbi:MAG: nucleotidyltransferase family protein [Candidatus Paceibacterota bacterium]|jgi:hypothetical protein